MAKHACFNLSTMIQTLKAAYVAIILNNNYYIATKLFHSQVTVNIVAGYICARYCCKPLKFAIDS